MSAPIITALRKQYQLKESLLHTAQELAHRASIYGVARVSYAYLASKCHCSRRTVMRHIQRLIDQGILAKTVLWIKGNLCEVNTYKFLLPWQPAPTNRGSDKMSEKFPHPPEEKEKFGSVEDKRRLDLRGLSFLTPGSLLYDLVQDHISSTELLRSA
jgi:Helix-turn-helix domain